MRFMDLPNIITASRFVLAALGSVVLLAAPESIRYPLALAIFAVAVASDWLDGLVARRMKRFSPLGTFMDPLADKVLVFEYFAYLMYVGAYPLWLFMALLARDLLHDAFRAYASSRRVSIGANLLNKSKTALQMTSILAILIALSMTEGTIPSLLARFAVAAMILALAFGILGAVRSVVSYRHLFTSGE